jgi:hypothetical protein
VQSLQNAFNESFSTLIDITASELPPPNPATPLPKSIIRVEIEVKIHGLAPLELPTSTLVVGN